VETDRPAFIGCNVVETRSLVGPTKSSSTDYRRSLLAQQVNQRLNCSRLQSWNLEMTNQNAAAAIT